MPRLKHSAAGKPGFIHQNSKNCTTLLATAPSAASCTALPPQATPLLTATHPRHDGWVVAVQLAGDGVAPPRDGGKVLLDLRSRV